jgi:hypothetical protein
LDTANSTRNNRGLIRPEQTIGNESAIGTKEDNFVSISCPANSSQGSGAAPDEIGLGKDTGAYAKHPSMGCRSVDRGVYRRVGPQS